VKIAGYVGRIPSFLALLVKRLVTRESPAPLAHGNRCPAMAQELGTSSDSGGALRILAIAYSCSPDKGSEPGAGWMWSRLIAGIGETWVITREDNARAILDALDTTPEKKALHFVYVPVPTYGTHRERFLVNGIGYILWQLSALREARRLQRLHSFAAVWHLTYANAWIGSVGSLVGPPFIYGPVGGCVTAPWPLILSTGVKGCVWELLRKARRIAFRFNPLARISWRRADLILAQNIETRDWFPRRHRKKVRLFPNVALNSCERTTFNRIQSDGAKTVLFAGRLRPWKGAALALRVLAMSPDWRLVVCGSGPDRCRLEKMADELGIASRVRLVGEVERSELIRIMHEEADVFLFPSLHDDAGWVVAEAIAAGLPVLCLRRGGPPLLAEAHGIIVEPRRPTVVIADLAAGLQLALSQPPGVAGCTPAHEFAFEARLEGLKHILIDRSEESSRVASLCAQWLGPPEE
jgi:glycosyltransferase involved in cell wall biosynthesis